MIRTIEMAIDPLGLRGLKHLALRLNDPAARPVIPKWRLGSWMNASRKQHHTIFDTQSDANAATDGESTKARP